MSEPHWFDSHCHIQERYLPDPDRHGAPAGEGGGSGEGGGGSGDGGSGDGGDDGGSAVAAQLERAWRAGVGRAVCVGTDAATSEQAVDLVVASRSGTFGSSAPELFATVGVHPHQASEGTAAMVTVLERAARRTDAVVAVGECGLDYYYEHSPRAVQRDVFAEQVALARERDLALVIHARDAWDDLFDVLTATGVPDRTVLHCFTGGPEEARQCLDLGMSLSFSGIVTFKSAPEVRRAAMLCPPDRMLVETDSPFLAPVPHRGRPNEPALVGVVGEAVAAVRGDDSQVVARSSWRAACRAFAVETG